MVTLFKNIQHHKKLEVLRLCNNIFILNTFNMQEVLITVPGILFLHISLFNPLISY